MRFSALILITILSLYEIRYFKIDLSVKSKQINDDEAVQSKWNFE